MFVPTAAPGGILVEDSLGTNRGCGRLVELKKLLLEGGMLGYEPEAGA